jgi:hypothetical protein
MKTAGLLFASLVAASTVLAQPKLEIAGNRFEFGMVPQNSTVVQFFWFKSVGTDTLRIVEIKQGCNCILTPLEQDWIAPGDSLSVGFFWETQKRVGKIGQYPYIFTNAGKEPDRVYLTAAVSINPADAYPVSVKPFKLELSRVAGTSLDSLQFILHNDSEDDLSCTVVSFPLVECEVVLPDILKAKSDNTGYIRVKKEYLGTEFQRSITLRLSDKQNSAVTIPIRRKFY